MKNYYFKTNLRCTGCVNKIKPLLDQLPGVNSWEVDLGSADKILMVKTDMVKPIEIITAVKNSGYICTLIKMD